MPRPRGDLCVNWKLRLSLPIATAIEQLTMDPTTGAPRYGARRRLIEHLLAQYLHDIGWTDASSPLASRPPLSDADIDRIETHTVERIYA